MNSTTSLSSSSSSSSSCRDWWCCTRINSVAIQPSSRTTATRTPMTKPSHDVHHARHLTHAVFFLPDHTFSLSLSVSSHRIISVRPFTHSVSLSLSSPRHSIPPSPRYIHTHTQIHTYTYRGSSLVPNFPFLPPIQDCIADMESSYRCMWCGIHTSFFVDASTPHTHNSSTR